MLARAADLDPLAARADGVGQRGVGVERLAHLVEVRDLDLRALLDRAAVGLQLAQDQLEQRRLAGAIGADQADLVAAQDGGGEALHDRPAAVGLAGVLQLGHDLAAAGAGIQVQPGAADHVTARGALVAQRHKPVDAADAAGAAGLDATADPDLFLRQQLVGAGVGQGLGLQLTQLGGLELGEVAGVAAQLAAVEFDDAGRHRVQKGPVVGDDQQRAAEVDQQVLQPEDCVQIQVVGRLVEQQHVGRGGQRLGQRDALAQAAGERVHLRLAWQLQALEGFLDALLPGPAVQRLDAGLQRIEIFAVGMGLVALAQRLDLGHAQADGLEHRQAGLEDRFLRDVDAAQALLGLQLAVVGLLEPGQDLEQRRLAAAVTADQAQALAHLQRHGRVIKQGHMAVGQAGVEEGEESHGRNR